MISDGAIFYANANIPESFVDGDTALKDLIGSSVVLSCQNDDCPAYSVSDQSLDFTSPQHALQISADIEFQTISLWIKKVNDTNGFLIDTRPGETAFVFNSLAGGTFFSTSSIYLDGVLSTYSDLLSFAADQWVNVTIVGPYVTAPNRPFILAANGFAHHYEAFFRSVIIHNRALTPAEITSNYNVSLLDTQANIELPALTFQSTVFNIGVVIKEISGATGYRLTRQGPGDSNQRLVKEHFTELNQMIKNLTPNTEYTIRLFYTSGSGYQFVGAFTASTLENISSNFDTSGFLLDGRFDLTSLDNSSLSLMSGVMNDLFTTGDNIDINVTLAREGQHSSTGEQRFQ